MTKYEKCNDKCLCVSAKECNWVDPELMVTHAYKMQENIEKAKALFAEGKYQEVIDFVDGLFGWQPGEMKTTGDRQLIARRCVSVLTGDWSWRA